jgi:cytochrome c oxidase cbb3-type subunit III
MRAGLFVLAVLLAGSTIAVAQAPATGSRQRPERPAGASPASVPRPTVRTPQAYPAEQVKAGEARFAAQCGFCHGRDATGGESGPDLTRSSLVAEDVRGDKIGPVLRTGRPEKGMPAFTLSKTDLTAIVAFIHDATSNAATRGGGRRSVAVADLQTGNAEAGKQYFNGEGRCATCHPPDSTIATIGARYQGLALLQRMLYPGSGARGTTGPPPIPPTMTVTTATGETISGKLAYRDEFTITLIDADGWTRSFSLAGVRVTGEDTLRAHVDQLGRYTDADMHNVFAYLQTLK